MVEVAEQIDMALSLGQLLKNARLQANLSREDVADHLRLTKDIVSRIEEDGYQRDEVSVFVRGYIRSYAKYVKIANQEVESYFYSLGIVEAPKVVGPAKFVFEEKTSNSKTFRWITMGVIILLAILALLWLFWQHDDNQTAPLSTSVVATPVTTNTMNTSQQAQQNNATAQPVNLSAQFAKQKTVASN